MSTKSMKPSYRPSINKKKSKRSPGSYGKSKSLKSKNAKPSKRKKSKRAPQPQYQQQIQGFPYQPQQQGVPYPYPYDAFNTDLRHKTAESDDYSVKSAEPFNPYQSYHDNENEQKMVYPLEGVSDLQLETKGTLPMKRLESNSSESESESHSHGMTTRNTNDDMIDSESSHSLHDSTEIDNPQSETMLGMDPNERIKFNANIQLNEDKDEDHIAPPQPGITLIGSEVNEKIEFNSNIAMPNNDILNKGDSITMIGAELNEKVVFKKYNQVNAKSNTETMMGAMEENECVEFNNIDNEYKNEGKRERNDVLTDLQNIKNHIVSALPDPLKYDFENTSHPKNNKKGVYNYADGMSAMYDKSNAMMKSMDNTYLKGKKQKKDKNKNKKRNGKSKSTTSLKDLRKRNASKGKSKSDIRRLPELELEPGAMEHKSKLKLKAKSKSKSKSKRKPNESKTSSVGNGKSKKDSKQRWQSFLERNGL